LRRPSEQAPRFANYEKPAGAILPVFLCQKIAGGTRDPPASLLKQGGRFGSKTIARQEAHETKPTKSDELHNPLFLVVDDNLIRTATAPDRIESLLPQIALLHGKLHHAVSEITRTFRVTKHPATLALGGHVFSRLFRARTARNNWADRQQGNKYSNGFPFHPIAPVMVKATRTRQLT
jgi:hypothetical protein